MRVFKHPTHTAIELRSWTTNKKGFVIISENEKTKFFPIKKCKDNWKFHINDRRIRIPFFYFDKTNCSTIIGFPNLYLWIIR